MLPARGESGQNIEVPIIFDQGVIRQLFTLVCQPEQNAKRSQAYRITFYSKDHFTAVLRPLDGRRSRWLRCRRRRRWRLHRRTGRQQAVGGCPASHNGCCLQELPA